MTVKPYSGLKVRQKQEVPRGNQKETQVKASAEEAADPRGAEAK